MKKSVRWYTEGELDYIYFKAKTLAVIAFIAGMMTTAVIYAVLGTMIK